MGTPLVFQLATHLEFDTMARHSKLSIRLIEIHQANVEIFLWIRENLELLEALDPSLRYLNPPNMYYICALMCQNNNNKCSKYIFHEKRALTMCYVVASCSVGSSCLKLISLLFKC